MQLSPMRLVRERAQLRLKVLSFVDTTRFHLAVVGLVLVDLVFFFLEESQQSFDALGKATFIAIGAVVVVFFTTEMLLKFYGYGFLEFFDLPWNVVDLFIVVVTVVGFFLWVFLEDANNVANAADGATTIRLVRVFRVFRLLRVFHVIRALAELHFSSASEDRISVPARRCVHVLSHVRSVFKLRFVSTIIRAVVSPQEVTWVIKTINSGALTQFFAEEKLDDEMFAFLSETCSILNPYFDPSPLRPLPSSTPPEVLPLAPHTVKAFRSAQAASNNSSPHLAGAYRPYASVAHGGGKVAGAAFGDIELASLASHSPIRSSLLTNPESIAIESERSGSANGEEVTKREGEEDEEKAGGGAKRRASGLDHEVAAAVDWALVDAELDKVLANFESWDFDIFSLRKLQGVGDKPLFVVGWCALNSLGLIEACNLDVGTVHRFLWCADALHRDSNPYHNSTHVADVTHAMFYFLHVMGLKKYLHPLETLAAILSAIVHDLDHPGANNQFYVMARDEIARKHNDKSVIENYSITLAFKMMQDPSLDVLGSLGHEDRMFVRQCVTDYVLATDNARHFELLGQFKALQMTNMIDFTDPKHRTIVLQIALHCADVSNPSKAPWLSNAWSERVQEEFWQQGDREKGLERTPAKYWDRGADAINVPLLQLSFIEFVVQPLFAVWLLFVHDVLPNFKDTVMEDNLSTNKKLWADKALQMKHEKERAAM